MGGGRRPSGGWFRCRLGPRNHAAVNRLETSMNTGAETTCTRHSVSPSGMIRGVNFPIGVGDVAVEDGNRDAARFRYVDRDDFQPGTSESGEPEAYPVWICAILLVAYCAVFWAGAVTVGGWILEGVLTILR